MTLLIKNVRVLGAAKEYKESCDLFVADDKISAIGDLKNMRADETLDGQGAYLSPGFIDVNTDSDHYLTLFEHPAQEDFLGQGVTTIFGGMCGSSLAPLLYGTLESVRKWGGPEERVNVDWHTVGELLAAIDRHPLAVNFGTLAGHGTIRRGITGDAIRELTKNEIGVFAKTLSDAMGDGAFGLSTNLGAIHTRKATPTEIRTLAQIVKDAKGIYAAHLLKPGKGIDQATQDVIQLAGETGVNTLISHFVPMRGAEKDFERALLAVESLPAETNFHFDMYPFDMLLLPFYTFLPDWVRTGGFETTLANIREDWLLPKIKKEMEPIEGSRFVVAQAPHNDFLVGKTLRDIADMYGVKDTRDALLKLMSHTNLHGIALYQNLDGGLITRAMTKDRALIASNAPSFDDSSPRADRIELKSDRTTQTFTRFLTLVERDNLLLLEDAIRKITREPARKFGLAGRGEIKEGNFADLACFKNGEVKFTVVNGKVAMKDGKFQGKFSGRALRHT